MASAPDLDVLWVVGENPLEHASLASSNAFVVVQDMFLTETAARADVDLSLRIGIREGRYGHQRNRRSAAAERAALKMMGAKPDLEIFGLLAKEMGLDLGPASTAGG